MNYLEWSSPGHFLKIKSLWNKFGVDLSSKGNKSREGKFIPKECPPPKRPPLRKSKSEVEETNEPATASEAPAPSTGAALRPGVGSRSRLNIGGGTARPLRPGPRVNIGGRGRLGAAPSTTTSPPATEQEVETSSEQTAASSVSAEETQPDTEVSCDNHLKLAFVTLPTRLCDFEHGSLEAVTTPVPDALTRLRNRPRLRVTERAHKVTTAAPAGGRRNLVSSLLPRRRPKPEQAETVPEHEGEAEDVESSDKSHEETAEPSTDVTSAPATTAAQQEPHDNNRLSSLLTGRRRPNASRRPGSLFPSTGGKTTSQEAA
ncbi:unnamed protein product [Timema podura]|uniref:Uncharacterized protein n=1 Tax=Timema podura TaxID=61482 RepID=A0ABN7NZ65_TIMPD|nr:unnamed protein product [Timema podura]